MATRTVESSNTPKLANLHDDFKTWWSGVHWTWNPKKYEAAKPTHCVRFLKEEHPRILSEVKAAVGTLKPHTLSLNHKPNPSGIFVSTQPKTDFAETGVEEVPLYNVAPYFEVRRSPKGGYGAFALQDIEPFTEIFFEKPLLQASNRNVLENFQGLSDEDKELYMNLASYDKLDTNKVIAIFKTNRFRTDSGNCGIYPISTRFNHACMPLCMYKYKLTTEELILTTKSATIKKGQEITISYGQTGDELLQNWGFICDCDICSRW